MADLDLVRRLGQAESGLAIVATTRADGTVQPSLVNAGVMTRPGGSDDVVAFVGRGDAVKLRNMRQRPRAAVVFRSGWEWATVEGAARIIGPGDLPDDKLATLLRDIFKAAGGAHDDWDEYDRVMLADRRAAVFITPERITSNAPS